MPDAARTQQARYAAEWGVSPAAICKAVRAGTVFLHDDGTVDVEASDPVWGRRHALRMGYGPPLDPASLEPWMVEALTPDPELDAAAAKDLERAIAELGLRDAG